MAEGCSRCARLAAENAYLKQENARLRARLQAIALYAQQVAAKAAALMASGNMPRGTWSLWKGRGEIARMIARIAG